MSTLLLLSPPQPPTAGNSSRPLRISENSRRKERIDASSGRKTRCFHD